MIAFDYTDAAFKKINGGLVMSAVKLFLVFAAMIAMAAGVFVACGGSSTGKALGGAVTFYGAGS